MRIEKIKIINRVFGNGEDNQLPYIDEHDLSSLNYIPRPHTVR